MGQGAAIIFATLFKCDIGYAQGAASNAIENNFVFALMPIITGAMKLYDILTTIDGAIDAYDEGGFAALAQYGMDEGSARLLMGSSMKIVGKMVSKARAAVKDTFEASSSGASSSASSAASSSAKAAKDVPMSEGKASAKNSSNVNSTGLGNEKIHQYKYHERIRARGVQDPKAHNFPYSFDKSILTAKPTVQQDGSLLYRKSGSLNGKNGVFEIALNPETKTIFHRTFRGTE
jgi:hypothetical protein